jgi:SAM-dependent methyltransferase
MTLQDFLAETYYRAKVPLFEWRQQKWVRRQFYHDASFKALDEELLSGPNPYPLAQIFPYGETPLRVLYAMAQAVHLQPSDHFVDLGCGRGRVVFFLSHFFGCKATGIDLTPSFIRRAQSLAKTHLRTNVSFHCRDFLAYDLKKASCIYLYGISYSEECLRELRNRIPPTCRVITVSDPLFKARPSQELEVCFPWGRGSLFIT